MRVVFMGTPEFAVPSLEAVASAHEVALVVTRPDAASRRGSARHPSPVREAADRLALRVVTPSDVRESVFAETLAASRPDIACVVAYGAILPPQVLSVPRLGCVNVHASLLPRWRGAAPVQRAILAGDDVTGVSIMRIGPGLDTGPVCLERETAVDLRDTASLTAALAEVGAEALIEALEEIASGRVRWTEQDEAAASYAAKVTSDDVAVTPVMTVAEADRRVRASSGSAPCRISVGERRVTVVRARPAVAGPSAGRIALARDGVAIGLADGALALVEVRPDGGRTMPSAAWANGARIGSGESWERA